MPTPTPARGLGCILKVVLQERSRRSWKWHFVHNIRPSTSHEYVNRINCLKDGQAVPLRMYGLRKFN